MLKSQMTNAPPEDNRPPASIPKSADDDIRNTHPARQPEQSGWVKIDAPHLSPGSLRFDPDAPAKAQAERMARQAATEPPLGPGEILRAPMPYAGATLLAETMPAPPESLPTTPEPPPLPRITAAGPPPKRIAPLPPGLPAFPEALAPLGARVLDVPEPSLALPSADGSALEEDSPISEAEQLARYGHTPDSLAPSSPAPNRPAPNRPAPNRPAPNRPAPNRKGLYFAIFAALIFGGSVAFAASTHILNAISPPGSVGVLEGQPTPETEGPGRESPSSEAPHAPLLGRPEGSDSADSVPGAGQTAPGGAHAGQRAATHDRTTGVDSAALDSAALDSAAIVTDVRDDDGESVALGERHRRDHVHTTTDLSPVRLRSRAVREGGRLEGSSGPERLTRRQRRARARELASRPPLTSRAVGQVVNGGRRRFRQCFDTALRRMSRATSSRIQLTLNIGPDGNVTRAQVSGRDFGNLHRCLTQVARRMRFPESREGGEVPIPFNFEAQTH